MADQSERPEPDHSEDPRRQETGEGYAETSPEGGEPDAPPGEEQSPESEAHPRRAGAERAPGTSTPEEGDPQQATGNPDAAGG